MKHVVNQVKEPPPPKEQTENLNNTIIDIYEYVDGTCGPGVPEDVPDYREDHQAQVHSKAKKSML